MPALQLFLTAWCVLEWMIWTILLPERSLILLLVPAQIKCLWLLTAMYRFLETLPYFIQDKLFCMSHQTLLIFIPSVPRKDRIWQRRGLRMLLEHWVLRLLAVIKLRGALLTPRTAGLGVMHQPRLAQLPGQPCCARELLHNIVLHQCPALPYIPGLSR